MDIIAEQLSDSAEIRKRLRDIFRKNASLKSVASDEEQDDEERSNKLSLLNTLLFITMIVAFAFMIYESRLIQHYFL